MKKTRRFRGPCVLLLAVLCSALIITWASAAERKGSLRVTLTDDDDLPVAGVTMGLCRVGEKNGTLTADFSGAGIAPASLLSDRDNAANAGKLAAWAGQHALTGAELTTDTAGRVFYDELTEGVYLVLCKPGQELTFTPFLVQIPTVINGTELYNIHSDPKAEVPGDPGTGPSPDPGTGPSPDPGTDPSPDPGTDPGPDVTQEPPGPGLPQTGVDPLPMYMLLALGVLLVVLGCTDLWRNRRKRDE